MIQQWFTQPDPLRTYMTQPSLFGALATSADFHARLTATVAGLTTWLAQPEQKLAVA